MALLIRGKTKCSLCGQVITDGEEVMSFGPFVTNRRDPLLRYSDQSFHAAHFWRQPDAEKAMARWTRCENGALPNSDVAPSVEPSLTNQMSTLQSYSSMSAGLPSNSI